MRSYFKPKLYLSARVSPDAHEFNNKIADILSNHFDVFKPHEFQCCTTDHTKIKLDVYIQDIQAMKLCDLAVLLPPYGRDCAWEIGWLKGANKPVFVYCEEETEWLRDAMVKGSIAAVFTNRAKMHKSLLEDPILRIKSYYLEDRSKLSELILKSFDDINWGEILMEGIG